MTPTTTTQTKLFPSKRVKIRCPQCHARLCDRVYDGERKQSKWMLHYKKARMNLFTNWMVMTCSVCNTSHRIIADKGIVQSERHPYIYENYDTGVQTKTSESADDGECGDGATG